MPDTNPSNTSDDRPAPLPGDGSPQIVVTDAQSGSVRVIALTSAGIVAGRLATNSLQLDAPVVSRTHARIDWDGSRVTITDLGSKSGTRLGHRRLSPQSPEVWTPDQEVHIGPYMLRLQFGTASPARPSPDAPADLHAAPTQRVAGGAQRGLALALSPAQMALTLTPGELTDVEVRVTNRTDAPLTVALVLEGLPESWMEPAPTLRVPPFSMKTTGMRVQAPASPESAVRPYDVRLRAVPQEDPSAAAELALEWRVAPFLAGEMSVSPHRVRGRDQAVVTVHLRNSGNTQAAYHLRAGDERQMVSATFTEDSMTLAPGETADVPLTIAASRRTFGGDRAHTLTVEVEEQDDIHGSPSRTLRDEVRFVQTALLPAWSPLALLIVFFLLYGLNVPSAVWSAVPGSGFLAGVQGGNIAAESARIAARATQQAFQGQTALAAAEAALVATQSAVAALPTEQQASAQTALAAAFQATVTSLAAVQTAEAQALAATGAALEAQLTQTAATQGQATVAAAAPTAGTPSPAARSTATPSPAAATPRPTTTAAPSPTVALQPTTVAAASGEVDPDSIAFGSIKKGTTSAPRTLSLKNTGAAPLTINEIVIGGVNATDFARVSGAADNCGAALAPGASCTITLTFTPATAGRRTGQLRIETSSAGGVLLVSLNGAGTDIPEVASIVRVGNSPTNAASVQFQVNFSEAVKGVSASNFSLVTLGGAVGASIASVSPASSTSTNQWTVTVNAGGGNKTIRLDFVNSNGVTNADGNAVEKLPFNTGDQIVIDTTAPTVALGNTPPLLTNNPATPFTFSGSDDVSSSVTFECRIDSASFAPCTSPFTPSSLPDGSRTFNVRSRDQAGNVSAPASYTWTIDTVPPDTTISGGPANSSTTGPTVTFTFTSEPGAIFQCRVGTGSFSGCTSPFTITGLTDGSHTFSVRAIDAAGNVDATPASRTWTVDATPPDTTITGGPSEGSTTGPTVSFTFSSEAGATFQCQVDGGLFTGCTSPYTITGLTDGSHTFRVRAIDAVGNVDPTPATRTWTVDAVPPDTSILSGPTGVISSTTVTFTFSASETATFQCRLNTGSFAGCSSPHVISGLTNGSQTFEVRAIDAVGNIDPTPATRTWTVDTQPPETTITSGPANGSTTGPSVTFNFTSSESGGAFECSVDSGPFVPCSSPQSLSLANGARTFAVRAIDAVGNVDPTPETRSWTVDAIPPAVTSVTSSTPNGTYGVGATINITVNFGEAVVLSGGQLQVQLNTGATVTISPFSGVSASGTYVVGAGQNTSDLDSVSLTLIAGATLRDAAGNNAILTIPPGQSLANLRDIVIDTTPPSSPNVTIPASATTVPSTTVTFNIQGTAEANSLVEVWDDANNNNSIDTGENVVASQQLTGGGTSFNISVNLTTGGNNFVVTATDAANNRSTPTDVPTITRSP
ncbi:choice-of-anchor D domain-containing protein [Roseiflexus sp.]|uniref:choice-of-anchor D domain-containing protein n=1 Tax=Roseiflexus sp. TaxID=2562120 RepID=UPI00398AD472